LVFLTAAAVVVTNNYMAGGLFNLRSDLVVRNMSFSGNLAVAGGALYNHSNSPTISNSSFFGNFATYGGAILNYYSSSTINNSSFSTNEASFGGAIHNSYSDPTIDSSTFTENYAQLGGAISNEQVSNPEISNSSFATNTASLGGAIYNDTYSHPNISTSSFSENKATSSGGAIYTTTYSNVSVSTSSFFTNTATDGGAIYNDLDSQPTITTSTFSGNSATGKGGAIYNVSVHSRISESSFFANAAATGGAIFNDMSASISTSAFAGNVATSSGGAIYNNGSSPSIINSSFLGNAAVSNGGALYNTSGSSPSIINSSFSGNAAASGGALYNVSNSSPSLANSILWGNSSSFQNTNNSNPTIRFSLVEGCKPGGSWNSACGNDGGDNLADLDPLFVNPIGYTSAPTTTGDLHLQPESLVINKGQNGLNTSSTDLDGNPRIIDTLIDLGAYESLPTLRKSVIGQGSINHTPNQLQHLVNSSVVLSATAKSGWSFAGWSGDLSGSSSPTTLLINSSKQITATFTNDPPTANAGVDSTRALGKLVTLDGSASFDADPTQTLVYAWAQTGGTPVTLAGANTAQPTFSAPIVADTLSFSLVVTDSLGLASAADSVTITVTNDAPVANAGADRAVPMAKTVTLDGSGSHDPDGHTPLTYAWVQTSGTPVTLSSSSAISPTFTAPSVAGTLTFSLVVTDSMGLASAADSVTVTVTNSAPVADAGSDQTVLVGKMVTLNASASSDPDGHTPLTYAWVQTSGTSVTLTGPNSAQPTFSAPSVAGTLTFKLIVTDSMGLASAADSVTIRVEEAPQSIYTIYLPIVLK
jgi:predicted outer membrane repeat protein